MAKFSIRKISSPTDTSIKQEKLTGYKKAKAEYLELVKKQAKSDFANSPLVLQENLTRLAELKIHAEEENLEDELSWIEEEVTKLKENFAKDEEEKPKQAFYKPILHKSTKKNTNVETGSTEPKTVTIEEEEINTENFAKKLEKESYEDLKIKFIGEDGTINPEIESWLSTFNNANISPVNIKDIFLKCKYLTEDSFANLKEISTKKEDYNESLMNAACLLANNGFNGNDILFIFEEFKTTKEKSFEDEIKPSILNTIISLKETNIPNSSTISFAKYLNERDFENINTIISDIAEMSNANISEKSITDILDNISIKSPTTGKSIVNKDSISKIIDFKKTLVNTRKNEIEERQSPLGQWKNSIIPTGNGDYAICEEGTITKFMSERELFSSTHQKEYEDLMNGRENQILVEISKHHNSKNKELDENYMRILNVLRREGIVNDQLTNLANLAFSENGKIGQNEIESISKIKQAGALSEDIPTLLQLCGKTEENKYNEEILKNICDLISLNFPLNDVKKLLPLTNTNNNGVLEIVEYASEPNEPTGSKIQIPIKVLDYIEYFNDFTDNKAEVIELMELCKDDDEKANKGKLEATAKLIEHKFKSTVKHYNNTDYSNNYEYKKDVQETEKETNKIFFSEFKEEIKNILDVAVDKGTNTINADAIDVVEILSKHDFDFKDIKKGLELCKDNNGKVDEKLSEILWEMISQNATLADCEKLIKCCTKENKEIKEQKANMVIDLFAKKYTKENILNLVVD